MMNKKNLKIVAYSMGIYLLVSLIASAYFYHDFQEKKSAIIEKVQNDSTHQLVYTHHEFNELLIRINNTLELLSNSRPLYDYFLYPSNRVKLAVETSWLRLVLAEKVFSKLSLSNNEGRVLFSVAYNEEDNTADINNTSNESLNGELLELISQLSQGEIFSEGAILNPQLSLSGVYKPVMQVIIPVDVFGSRKGYVTAELNEALISDVVGFSPILSTSPSIINKDGYYLLNDDPSLTFGHLIENRADKTLKAESPELWQMMLNQQMGSIYLNQSVYSFYQFSLGEKHAFNRLYFLLHYPEERLNVRFDKAMGDIIEDAIFILLLLSVIIIPFGLFIRSWNKANLDSQLAKSALEGMSAVVITDKHQRIIKVNSAFCSISGYSVAEALGKTTFDVLASNDTQSEKRLNNWKQVEDLGAWQGEIEALSKEGSELSLLVRIQVVKNKRKETQYYIISYIDISQRKVLEKELRYLSEKDSLSDCWNRRKFEIELENHMLLNKRYFPVYQCCLTILDIDWFKRINDTQGHEIGDEVIRSVANILNEGCRDTDFVARIGGEEFAIIMPHTELSDAEMVVNRLRVAISQIDKYKLTISGGLTSLGSAQNNAYKCADLALYESKTNGRNRISICTSVDDLA